MSWLMQRASEVLPEDLTTGIAKDATEGVSEAVSNSAILEMLSGVGTPAEGFPGVGMNGDAVTSVVANTDQTDGQQAIVANTDSDMDWWCAFTGQEQAEDGLESIVDAVESNNGGVASETVEFKSHGHENSQHVASGEGGRISGNLSDEQAEQFERLGELVEEDGEILMAGCNVGKDYTDHHAEGDSMLDDIAEASDRSVRAGVAVQLPFDGIEGSSVLVNPDGTYELDTSSGKQVYDVTANGAMGLKNTLTDSDSSWSDRLSDSAGTLGEMAGDYWDIGADMWNGTHEAEGWDMLSDEQRAELEE
jgi:hypothetical protein